MNILKHFGIEIDKYSNDNNCIQCGKELYTHDAKFCSRNCERKYMEHK